MCVCVRECVLCVFVCVCVCVRVCVHTHTRTCTRTNTHNTHSKHTHTHTNTHTHTHTQLRLEDFMAREVETVVQTALGTLMVSDRVKAELGREGERDSGWVGWSGEREASSHMCMHTYMHSHALVRVQDARAHTYTHKHTHTQTHTNTKHTHKYIPTFIHTCIHTFMHTYIHTCIHRSGWTRRGSKRQRIATRWRTRLRSCSGCSER